MAEKVMESFLSQPVIRTYLFYVGILSFKMLLMSVLTGAQRYKNKAFANPEDAEPRKLKVKVNEDVERVRRAHLNDLENIPVFIIVCLVYLTTNPSAIVASALIRVFTAARILHTLVYAVVVIPQPARALAWIAGYVITIYMSITSILHYLA
ncbi:microsomal glutathione S-transferase 1 isoform X2 [Anthonomus grandis grandis]|uniref:microsomal glutathione S-transferase 1 isoform X2 n=1 Tax=Anthonomus grandis grandis TaxID=2921223 RepID=UPI002166034F|nr:microsomal glutathione S-transferase 1 isoform X2 [Anthonomus grandis grandis]